MYSNSVIALVQRFIFVQTHTPVWMDAVIGPYKNKSLNSYDSPYLLHDHSSDKQEAQGLSALLDKTEDNDHINWIT